MVREWLRQAKVETRRADVEECWKPRALKRGRKRNSNEVYLRTGTRIVAEFVSFA